MSTWLCILGWKEKEEWALPRANIEGGPGSRYELFFRRHLCVSFHGSLSSARSTRFQNNWTVTLGKMVKLVKTSLCLPLLPLYASLRHGGDFFPIPQSHHIPMFIPGCSSSPIAAGYLTWTKFSSLIHLLSLLQINMAKLSYAPGSAVFYN